MEVLVDERFVEAGFIPSEPVKKAVLAMPPMSWSESNVVPRLEELKATVSVPYIMSVEQIRFCLLSIATIS